MESEEIRNKRKQKFLQKTQPETQDQKPISQPTQKEQEPQPSAMEKLKKLDQQDKLRNTLSILLGIILGVLAFFWQFPFLLICIICGIKIAFLPKFVFPNSLYLFIKSLTISASLLVCVLSTQNEIWKRVLLIKDK